MSRSQRHMKAETGKYAGNTARTGVLSCRALKAGEVDEPACLRKGLLLLVGDRQSRVAWCPSRVATVPAEVRCNATLSIVLATGWIYSSPQNERGKEGPPSRTIESGAKSCCGGICTLGRGRPPLNSRFGFPANGSVCKCGGITQVELARRAASLQATRSGFHSRRECRASFTSWWAHSTSYTHRLGGRAAAAGS